MTTDSRAAAVRRVLWLVLALNLSVTAIKIAVGLYTGALAVVADGFHSVVDSSSNLVALLGLWVASRPADANHPYGHQKFEAIATLGIGGLLLIAAFEIGRGAVERLLGAADPPLVTPVVLGLLALTFVVNLGVAVFEAAEGRRLKSMLLAADAAHTRTDLYITLSVIGALIGTRFGLEWLDPVVAGAVVVLLFRAAFAILRSTSGVLTDQAVADPALVGSIVQGVPGVTAVGTIRSRGRDDAAYVDLNIRVNPAMDADQAHSVASEVEHRIAEAMPGVVDTVVHIEPAWVGEPSAPLDELTFKLRSLAQGQGIGLHDLHAHIESDGGYSVEMHLEMDAELSLREAHAAADQFEARAREALPQLRALVTHLEPLPTSLPDEEARLSPGRRTRLQNRLMSLANAVAGRGACHDVQLHDVAGHLTATLHITQPAAMPLIAAHALAERVEQELHAHEPRLNRVVVHVEPPDADDRKEP
jgi:cation diffusion facilitator family transporter